MHPEVDRTGQLYAKGVLVVNGDSVQLTVINKETKRPIGLFDKKGWAFPMETN